MRQSIDISLSGMPSIAIFPPWLILAIMSRNACAVAGHFKANVEAFRMPSCFCTSASVSSARSSATVAPIFFARSSRNGFISVTTTKRAPACRTTAAAISADGPRAGDQHVLAQHRKGKRRVHRVAERIENRGDVEIDSRSMTPDVGHRQDDIFGERARPVHADAHGMRAQMPSAGETIAAASAHHVAFAADNIAGMKIVDVRSHFDDFAHEFMTDRHGNRNGALRPIVPFVNVDVSAANSRALHADQNIVNPRPRGFDILQPQTLALACFYDGFHSFSLSLNLIFFPHVENPATGVLPRAMTASRQLPRRHLGRPGRRIIMPSAPTSFTAPINNVRRQARPLPTPRHQWPAADRDFLSTAAAGSWAAKESSTMSIVPWMEMGWNVVNVEYRMAKVSLAPAAVEDCLCALRCVADHAKENNVDLSRMVVMGESAGGHLALTTGMIPESVGLDRECPGGAGIGVFTGPGERKLPKVAAILDWYGISDLNDMLSGPNQRAYAVEWFGSLPNAEEIAKRVSPLTYVRRGLPPVLIIHGDADPIVPYSQATRLRDALASAGAPHDMYTVKGGGHGNYSAEERVKIYEKIHEFLTKYKVM